MINKYNEINIINIQESNDVMASATNTILHTIDNCILTEIIKYTPPRPGKFDKYCNIYKFKNYSDICNSILSELATFLTPSIKNPRVPINYFYIPYENKIFDIDKFNNHNCYEYSYKLYTPANFLKLLATLYNEYEILSYDKIKEDLKHDTFKIKLTYKEIKKL